jgi:hypothetical protein
MTVSTPFAPAHPLAAEPIAAGVASGTGPEALARIAEPGIAAAIWERAAPPGFLAWIEALPHHALPTLRATLAPEGVLAALETAAERLPEGAWRRFLVADAADLACRFAAILGASRLRVRLEVVVDDACRRFHLDRVTARLLCTYCGPGTECGPAGPSSSSGAPTSVRQLAPGSAAILRGALWPGERTGLLHRSPPIAGTGETRLLLAIDPDA